MTGRIVNDGMTRHPSSDLTGEDVYMCSECGAIDGHTAKCAVARIAKAKNVTNEAADRLREGIDIFLPASHKQTRTQMQADLTAALAAERRATVERIEALDRFSDDSGIEYVEVAAIRAAILDEEAAR